MHIYVVIFMMAAAVAVVWVLCYIYATLEDIERAIRGEPRK